MGTIRITFVLSLFAIAPFVACSHPKAAGKPTAVRTTTQLKKDPAVAVEGSHDKKEDATPDKAIYFDTDSRLLPQSAGPILAKVAQTAIKHNVSVRIEGNTDERGTTEYNLALGEERARAAKSYLEKMGVPSNRVEIVTHGSLRPKATGHDEASWSQNRRDDIYLKAPPSAP